MKTETHQIQASTIHVLHADVDLAIAVESPIEADDVGRVALVKNPEEKHAFGGKAKVKLPVVLFQSKPPFKSYLPTVCLFSYMWSL